MVKPEKRPFARMFSPPRDCFRVDDQDRLFYANN